MEGVYVGGPGQRRDRLRKVEKEGREAREGGGAGDGGGAGMVEELEKVEDWGWWRAGESSYCACCSDHTLVLPIG